MARRELRVAMRVIVMISVSARAQQAAKQPWEWTLDERIAARCDRPAARARVDRAREQRLALTTMKDGALAWLDVNTSSLAGRLRT